MQATEYLYGILQTLPKINKKKRGRPRADIRDIVMCLYFMQKEGKSSRAVYENTNLAKGKRYISKIPHFNSLTQYLNNPELTPILHYIIQQSATPLAILDNCVAVDSTGFSQHHYSRYFDDKYKFKKLTKDYSKLHLLVDTKTNIIISARVTKSNVADSRMFKELLLDASRYFRIKEVYGDGAYASRYNMQLAVSMGVIPFFAFKSNTTGRSKGYNIGVRCIDFILIMMMSICNTIIRGVM